MENKTHDIVILGGAFAGASTAILLKRRNPALKVLIIESKPVFDYKVGEATVEMSGMFIHRRLGLWDYMSRHQLPKQGLRYWYRNEKTSELLDYSEAGAKGSVEVSSFQLNRATMDEHLHKMAIELGTEIARPARVTEVKLGDYDNQVTYDQNGQKTTVRAPWVIDASGKACLLSRQLGLWSVNEEHPVGALWARFDNVVDMDANLYPRSAVWNGATITSRRAATNHFCGFGWWIWFIPLAGGATSVGLVYDKRVVKIPPGSRRDIFLNFLEQQPGARQLLKGATMQEDDFRGYDQIAYWSKQYMGKGWALVGDAGCFIDPYYSPGLDHVSLTAEATSRIVGRWFDGRFTPEAQDRIIAQHNDRFIRGYHWLFDAVYKDKYLLFSEGDFTTASFLMDTALYYMFLVRPTFAMKNTQFTDLPPYQAQSSRQAVILQMFIKKRMIRLTMNRLRAGLMGHWNDGRRFPVRFGLGLRAEFCFLQGAWYWIRAELRNLLIAPRVWFKPSIDLDQAAKLANANGQIPAPEILFPGAATATAASSAPAATPATA